MDNTDAEGRSRQTEFRSNSDPRVGTGHLHRSCQVAGQDAATPVHAQERRYHASGSAIPVETLRSRGRCSQAVEPKSMAIVGQLHDGANACCNNRKCGRAADQQQTHDLILGGVDGADASENLTRHHAG